MRNILYLLSSILLNFVLCDHSISNDAIIYRSDGIHHNHYPNYNGFESIDALKFNNAIIKTLSNSTISKLLLVKGKYYVSKSSSNFVFNCNQNAKPLLIDFQGSTIIFQNYRTNGIQFGNCFNLTFQNAIIKWDINQLTITQGTITAISNDRTHLNVSTHAGYPHMINATSCSVMDPIKREYKSDTVDFGGYSKKITAENTTTIYRSPGVIFFNC